MASKRALIAAAAVWLAAPAATAGAEGLSLKVLSGRADLASGGDALVGVSVPKGVAPGAVRVRLGNRDVTPAFRLRPNGRLEGVVEGLRLGANVVTAYVTGGSGTRLTITNHPNGGPVFSGPHVQPWFCQKTAVDALCNQPPVYTWLYKSTDTSQSNLQPYDPKNPPDDVATTTTDHGVEVPFIVRQETGYQDRDQYKILTLFDAAKPWSRWEPQKHWNHKVLITHGGGCGGDHDTGNAPLDDYSGTIPETPGYTQSYVTALGRGFAVLSTALNNNGHNCNLVTQAESMIMAKERLIEQYGDIRYTIGTGCSGGSITQQQVANAYPGGVYDGLVVTCAYPDSLSTGSQFADYNLLRQYFEDPNRWGEGVVWTPAQWGLVEGRPDHVNAILADELFFKAATDPSGGCVPADQVYTAQNPGGVRCSILDYMINVLGPRPQKDWTDVERKVGHGFAGSPFGNAGVQYGLDLLGQGLITAAQFVDLNEKIGGFDIDAKYAPQRLQGDDASIAAAYRSGAINEATHLSRVAIIDHAGPDPGAAHDYVHTWWMRDRIQKQQGHVRNHILWYGPAPLIGDLGWANEAMLAMDRWLAAVEKDKSDKPLAQKIVDDKPADITDRCTASVCEQYVATRYGTPRTVAGGPKESDVNKCTLKPLVRDDYPVSFSDGDWARLQKAFPTGVCDWSKPGVGQQDTVAWQTYQDADGKVIYGGRPLPASVPPVSCSDVRSLRVGLPRGRLVSARVYVNGKRVRTLRGRALRKPLRLTRFGAGRLKVRVRARTRSGRNVSKTRRFSTCRSR